jgi:hypothetical protein
MHAGRLSSGKAASIVANHTGDRMAWTASVFALCNAEHLLVACSSREAGSLGASVELVFLKHIASAPTDSFASAERRSVYQCRPVRLVTQDCIGISVPRLRPPLSSPGALLEVASMFLPSAPVVMGLYVLVESTGVVPTIDVATSCRAAQKAITAILKDAKMANVESCLTQEAEARKILVRDWASYAAADRTRCIKPASYMPSYVEWLTCLENAGAIRKPLSSGAGTKVKKRDAAE